MRIDAEPTPQSTRPLSIALGLLMLCYGVVPSWSIVFLPLLVVLSTMLALGMAYLVALIPTVLPLLRGDAQWVATPTVAGVSARGTP